MAPATHILSVIFVMFITTAANAQAPDSNSIPPHLMQWINSMAQSSSTGYTNINTNTNTNTMDQPQPPQLSLVESFGPIYSQALATGTQTDYSPFNTHMQTQTQTNQQRQTGQQTQAGQQMQTSQQTQAGQQMQTSQQTQAGQQMQTSQRTQTGQQTQTSYQTQGYGTQTQGTGFGTNFAQFFSGSPTGMSGASGTNANSNFISSGSALPPASDPLGNDILFKVKAFMEGTPTAGSSNPPTSSSSSSSSVPQMAPASTAGNWLTSAGPGVPAGPGGPGGPGGMPMLPPLTPIGGMMPGMLPLDPLRNQAMLRVGRKISQRFGVNQHYQIHGCEDPTLLFTGSQKVMATMAMAQGCHSIQAMRVCQQAQIKERIGNSLLTSRILPPQITSRLESCLSAKVLIAPITSGMLSAMASVTTGVPSMRECGMLLSTVMDGGSLDPESMIHSRRSMVPWSCNESNVGPNGIAYRVCCPGKVHEPTLQEATILRRMLNA